LPPALPRRAAQLSTHHSAGRRARAPLQPPPPPPQQQQQQTAEDAGGGGVDDSMLRYSQVAPEAPLLPEVFSVSVLGKKAAYSLDEYTTAQLRQYLPHLVTRMSGLARPGWAKAELRPPWWPADYGWHAGVVTKDLRRDDLLACARAGLAYAHVRRPQCHHPPPACLQSKLTPRVGRSIFRGSS
jgi:hypothetical protein